MEQSESNPMFSAFQIQWWKRIGQIPLYKADLEDQCRINGDQEVRVQDGVDREADGGY